MRTSAARLILSWILGNVGYRIALVALPLLAIDATGSAWTVGLVGGASGLPVITAPWWTRPAQARLASPRALMVLMLAEGCVSLMVPISARLGTLDPTVMIAIGLMTGLLNAVSGPLDSSLLACIGDAHESRIGQRGKAGAPGSSAARLLSVQDASIKAAVTFAPLAALALIGAVGLTATVAADGVMTLIGATLLVGLRVPGVDRSRPAVQPRVRRLLRGHREIMVGFGVRGTGCAAWFAFTLCLALLGQQFGMGVELATVALSAYSAGAVGGAALGVWAAGASRPAVLNSASWLVAGAGWVVIGWHPTLLVAGLTAAIMGLAVPAGNAATTALVTRAFTGAERRSMLTAQATVVNGTTTLGTLVGGPLIAVLGARSAVLAAGAVVLAVGGIATALSAGQRAGRTSGVFADRDSCATRKGAAHASTSTG